MSGLLAGGTCRTCGAPTERVTNDDPEDLAQGGVPSVLYLTCDHMDGVDLDDGMSLPTLGGL